MVLNENTSIGFNKHFNSTIRLSVKDFGGKHYDKHSDSTVRCFIKDLAVLV